MEKKYWVLIGLMILGTISAVLVMFIFKIKTNAFLFFIPFYMTLIIGNLIAIKNIRFRRWWWTSFRGK